MVTYSSIQCSFEKSHRKPKRNLSFGYEREYTCKSTHILCRSRRYGDVRDRRRVETMFIFVKPQHTGKKPKRNYLPVAGWEYMSHGSVHVSRGLLWSARFIIRSSTYPERVEVPIREFRDHVGSMLVVLFDHGMNTLLQHNSENQ